LSKTYEAIDRREALTDFWEINRLLNALKYLVLALTTTEESRVGIGTSRRLEF
jgi:hypothetical protein